MVLLLLLILLTLLTLLTLVSIDIIEAVETVEVANSESIRPTSVVFPVPSELCIKDWPNNKS